MEKCIFTTRFKDCCKEKGYTRQYMADKLNISLNGLNHYLRKKNPNFPPLDIIIKMAEILDVDVEYLVNEHRKCKNYKSETICDVTSLDSGAAETLINMKPILCKILSDLINHPRFDSLLFYTLQYSISHNKIVTISNPLNPDDDENINIEHRRQEMLKFSATDTFGQIIDDIYENNRSLSEAAMFRYLLNKMLTEVEEHKKYADTSIEARNILKEIIALYQKQIATIDKDSLLVTLPPEEIIDNIDLLSNELLQN